MQHTLIIDQLKSMEWGLSLSQAVVFDYIVKAPLWANVTTIDGVARWRFDVAKMLLDLPMISNKKNTFQIIVQGLIKLDLLDRLVIGGRDTYFKITEKGKNRNRANMDGSSSMEGGNKSTHHGFKSTQGGSRSIVKNEDVSKQADTSTMDLNPPAYNNIYNNNTIISTNKSNIDSSNIDNIISNNTDEEILKNENKEVIKNNLLLYGEVLDSKGFIYSPSVKKTKDGKSLNDSVPMSNFIRSEKVKKLMDSMGRNYRMLFDNLVDVAVNNTYYTTRISSFRGFYECWAELFNLGKTKRNKNLLSNIAI